MIDFKKAAAIGIVASTPFILAGCNLFKGASQTGSGNQTQTTSQASPATQTTTGATVITYTENGFSSTQATAKVGETVTFQNNSSKIVEVNSVPHPTHTQYPELNLNAITAGQSKSSSFTKPGVYKYHNHLNASENGQITVE